MKVTLQIAMQGLHMATDHTDTSGVSCANANERESTPKERWYA